MSPRHKLAPLSLTLSLVACTCGPEPEPRRVEQPVRPDLQQAIAKAMPIPPGELISIGDISKFMPDEIAGFTATRAVEKRETPVPNGGRLHVVHGEFGAGDMKLQLELTDSLHAPAIANIMAHQHGTARPVAARITPRVVRGRPALSQLHAETRTAIVNVLVRKRLLVNIKVLGTDTLDQALAVADAIDYGGLAALLPATAPQDDVSANFKEPHGAAPAATADAPAAAAAQAAEAPAPTAPAAPAAPAPAPAPTTAPAATPAAD